MKILISILFQNFLFLLNVINYYSSTASKLDHSDSDCLAVVLLTHGLVGDYVHAHDHPYPLQDIWRPFTADKCPSLAGKPKLFFIQVS